MAYGNSQAKNIEKRMADLGRVALTADLVKLRTLCIEANGVMADAICPTSILDNLPEGKQLDAMMAPVQANFKGTLNAVWAEKAMLTVKSAVVEQVKKARNNLFGRFKHLIRITAVNSVPFRHIVIANKTVVDDMMILRYGCQQN